MKKINLSRNAIDLLKAAHESGIPFSVADAQCYLSERGFYRSQLGKHRVGEWMRQARYELADNHISVTNPVKVRGYVSNPNASPDERVIARSVLVRNLGTRASNTLRQLASDAAQVDASPEEIERTTRIRIAAEILQRV